MAVSAVAYVGLLALVALFRGVELLISRRHQQALDRLGAHTATDPHFVWMVALHAAILIGAAFEVILLGRPFIPLLAIASGAVVVFANALRWWVIYTLGPHWNVRVVDSAGLGVITSGPFRVIRHPNYVAVFLELAALPLVHTAWITALAGSAARHLGAVEAAGGRRSGPSAARGLPHADDGETAVRPEGSPGNAATS